MGIHLKGKITEAKYIQLELHQFKKGCNLKTMKSSKEENLNREHLFDNVEVYGEEE